MSVVTISAIKADIGGYVGHSAVHPDSVNSCGVDVNLVMSHRRGIDAALAAASKGMQRSQR